MSRAHQTPAHQPRRRLVIVAVPLLLAAALAAAFGPLLVDLHRSGWSGMVVLPGQEGEEPPEWMRGFWIWSVGPGQVFVVSPESPADRAGIRRGDRVLAIDGVPTSDHQALRRVYTGLRTGDRVTYELQRGRDVWRVELQRTSPLRHGPTLTGLLAGLLVILTYLVISVLVAWSRPPAGHRGRPALIFYLLCLATATSLTAFLYNSTSVHTRGLLTTADFFAPQRLAVWALLLVTALAGSTLILHLALVFPRRRPLVVRHPRVLHWVHMAPWLLCLLPFVIIGGLMTSAPGRGLVVRAGVAGAVLLSALLRLRAVHRRGAPRHPAWRLLSDHPWATSAALLATVALCAPLIDVLPKTLAVVLVVGVMLLALFAATIGVPLVYTVLTLVALTRSYRQSGVEEKRQIRWPLWGLTMTLVGGVIYSLVVTLAPQFAPQILDSQSYHACNNVLFTLIYLPLPVTFAFAIAKYRLMDVDLLLRKTAVYGATTAVVLAGSLLLAGGLSLALLSWTRVDSPLVAVVATLALVALFVPVRNRMQTLVDRRFGAGAGDRREALETLRRQVLAAADLEALLGPMAETVQQSLESRAAVVLVRPPERSALVARAKVGLPDQVVGELTLDAAAFADTGRLVERDELPLDEEHRGRLRRLRLHLLAPARRQGQVVGALAVGRKLDGGTPDADEREFLAAVADQLALAVGTLGPRREARELDQAREIQESLLPHRLPTVPGVELAGLWRPAREVAGDYYDVLDFGDGRAGLCIADVVGKGMPAAMTMSGLQAAVRAIAAADVPPDRVCEQVRRVVTSSLTGGKFVTFFYAVLDAPARRLTYTNAGHAPPLLVHADGRVESLETGGGALTRLLAGTPLHCGELALAPGDRLLLYTDGVTEAQGADGSMFGDRRLVEVLRSTDGDAAAVQSAVADAVTAFSDGAAQDDLTLLVVRLPATEG